MDHATLTDNTGRKADFRNVVLILTSNAGSREMSAGAIGFEGSGGDRASGTGSRDAAAKSKAAVERVFSPEFRNRLAKGYDPVFGARPLARVIQRDVRDPLTDELLFGRLEHGGTVTIAVSEDKLSFAYEPRVSETVN
jgi:ATP-dependent Clp protease ATP-binding subunit ClpA